MKTNNPTESFETSDLGLAAFLAIEGLEILGVNRGVSGRATFHFRDRRGRPEMIQRYINRKALVEPAMYLERIRSIKSLI